MERSLTPYLADLRNLIGDPNAKSGLVADWPHTMAYARSMSRAHQHRYRVTGCKYPDGKWRYGAYPAPASSRWLAEHLEPTA